MTATDVPDVPDAPRITITQCNPAELRTLFLFEKLTDEQLQRLCAEGHVEIIEPGQVFREGDPAECLYVLIEGTVVLSRNVGGDDVEISRTSQRGVYAGSFQAYLRDRVPQVYPNSLRVTEPSTFYVLGAQCFAQIMTEWFPMAVHLLEGLFFGGQRTREAVGQRERLLALGSLTAGLTHELNNPAAAAVRATASLRERVAGMRGKLRLIAAGKYERASLESIIELQQRAVEKVSKAPKLSPLETSDAEDELSDWLDDHGIRDGWQLAPTFVQAGLDTEWLNQVSDCVGAADARTRAALAELHRRDRTADERDRGRHDPGLHPGRRRQAVLPAGPRAVPGRGRARPAGQHPADDGREDRQGRAYRQGLRPLAAADPGLRHRAQPGLDEPDRQRGVGDGRDRHADHPHGAGRRQRARRGGRRRPRHP